MDSVNRTSMCRRHKLGAEHYDQFGDSLSCYMCRLEDAMSRYMPRDPRYRYWTGDDGWRYCWTTEKLGDDKYAAFLYKPVGKGARTGKARSYVLVKEVHFVKRSSAKARAAKWFNTRHGANRITV